MPTTPSPEKTSLKQKARQFAIPHLGKALSGLSVTLLGYFIFAGGALWSFHHEIWFAFTVFIFLASFFLVKLFTIQHDCGHGSFFKKSSWNTAVGRFISLFTLVPFAGWKREHNIHHANVAHLEKHSIGEVMVVMTVDEYRNASTLRKLYYRIYCTPFFLLTITPILYYFFRQRYPIILQKPLILSSVLNNLFIVLFYSLLSWFLGWQIVIVTLVLCVYFAGVVGIFLFYVQHQFEDMVWYDTKSWQFETAAIHSSSFLKLPKLLDWLTGSIGYHHIHHYNSRIPSYRLKEAYTAISEFNEKKPVNFWQAIQAFKLKLWSIDRQKMISWKEYQHIKQ
jgi:omega-6 fatty acid desaturase (delta-12 desaturase)